jgi:hypothetical protein
MPGQRITEEDLVNRFVYHAPSPEQGDKYMLLRRKALEFATMIVDLVPPGRQASLAVTAVEEAVMRANAAIAQDTPRATTDVLLGDACPECGGLQDFHTATCSAHAHIPAGTGG